MSGSKSVQTKDRHRRGASPAVAALLVLVETGGDQSREGFDRRFGLFALGLDIDRAASIYSRSVAKCDRWLVSDRERGD